MRRIIIFILSLIQELITTNWTKFIFIIIGLSSLYLSDVVDKEELRIEKIVSEFISDGEHVYYYKSASYYKYVKYGDEGVVVKDKSLIITEYTDLYITFTTLYIISLILIISAFFIGNDDREVSWEFEDCFEIAFTTLIRCEIQDGKYYYTIFDRLISIRDDLVGRKNLSGYFSINRFVEISNLPKFETKSRKRESLINRLGL
jgi:hypothetical protein